MASFISRLFGRFRKSKTQTSRRTRQERSRKLLLEPMEARRLMAGDLGSIGGNVFTDLTDNGFTVDDPDLQSVTVWLYRDGAGTPGAGAFQSGSGTAGGDDVLVGTTTSNATGGYLFSGLGPGRYFVEQAPVTGQLQRPAETVKTVDISDSQSEGVGVLTVDNFDDDTAAIAAEVATPTVSTQTTTTGSNAIGGQRDLVVNLDGGSTNGIDVNVIGGALNVSSRAGSSGNAVLTYDGVDGSATTIDHANLDLDLEASGATAFQFLAGSEDAGNSLTIDVYSGAANLSTLTVALPVTAGALPTAQVVLDFADFVGTADFNNVTAIRFQVNTGLTSQATLDLTQTLAPFLSTQNMPNLNPMSIGNQVWLDSNNNGAIDGTETGIAGVSLELYQDTNTNGAYNPGVDTLVDTTTSAGAGGNYLFDNLLPGDYFVVLPTANFNTGGPLEGLGPSSGVAALPNNDVDGDNNGVAVAGVGVVSAGVLTLASAGEPDGAGNNDNLRLDFLLTPQVDLQIEKTVGSPTVTAGNQVTYTLQVTNNGPATSNNVVVVDNLPDFMTIVSVTATPDGTVTQTGNATGEIQVTYPSLASGATRTITVVASVPAGQAAQADVINSATVDGDGVDTNTQNDSDQVEVDVVRSAVLTITKTDAPDPTAIGQPLNYQIIVTNTGPSTATNVQILDTLPAGLDFDSVTTTAGTAVESSGQITVNVPTLAVGASVTVNIATTVLAGFTGSTIPNAATADADESELVTADASTTINPQIDLAITKVDDIDPVNRGGTLTYTLSVTNNGPGAASNVEVVDTLPPDVTFSSATVDGTAVTPTISGNQLTFNLGSMLSGAAARVIAITVNVSQTAAASFTNSAIVRSTESTGGFDTNTANNTATATTGTQATIDLGVTKTASAATIIPGQALTYTITVTNAGPSDATGVRLVDNIPDGITITSVTSDTAGTTITIPPSAQDSTAANNDDLSVDIGNLAEGDSVVLTVVATVLASTRGTLTNTAVVSTTTAGLIETNTTNNTASVNTTLTPQVDVAVNKTDTSGGTVVAGNTITYTIGVTNNGPSTATGVTLTDTLPAGLTFTNATSTQGTVSQAGGVITGTLGEIASGATVTITVNATVNADASGTLTNTASVTSVETDTVTSNNSDSVATTVNRQIDLAITKTKVNPNDPAVPSGSMTYTILVTNNGPSAASSVVMTDVLPAGLTFTSGSSTVGTVTATGQTVTGTIGNLAAGASATVTVVVGVASTATGTFSNTATVVGAETESNTANNSSTLSTNVAQAGSIAGRTYIDADRNGVFTTGESGIQDVTVTLTGTDILGNPVSRTTTTNANGEYTFSNVMPGTYTVTQTQPNGFQSVAENVGSAGGTDGENAISAINLTSGVNATAYNFGEILNPMSKRRFLASSTAFD